MEKWGKFVWILAPLEPGVERKRNPRLEFGKRIGDKHTIKRCLSPFLTPVPFSYSSPAGRILFRTAGIAAILIAVAAGWAHAEYGSVSAAVSVARGDPATLVYESLHLGSLPANGSTVGVLRLRNNTDEVIQIAQAASGCSCATAQDLPVNIEPGRTGEVKILVTVSAEPGEFRRSVRLNSSVGVLSYTITAVVVPPPSENQP